MYGNRAFHSYKYDLEEHYRVFHQRKRVHHMISYEVYSLIHGSLTVVSNFPITKSLKTLNISMLLSFFIVKFVKIIVLTWANVCYNRHRR